MNTKSMDLVWIVVNDIKQAIQFYTDTIGLKLMEFHEEFGWAELEGPAGGSRLGIAQKCTESPDDKPGQNAVMTFSVASIEKAIAEMSPKGIKLVGKPLEIPGHVIMQTAEDTDGNRFQLVQVLHHKCCHC
jgi:predicted enzyme related to lactoylglutathione lyase